MFDGFKLPSELGPAIAQRIRITQLVFSLKNDSDRVLVSIGDGKVVLLQSEKDGLVPAFTLSAATSTWAEFAKPEPRPGFHDLTAMLQTGNTELSGEALPFFQNLMLIKLLLQAAFRGSLLARRSRLLRAGAGREEAALQGAVVERGPRPVRRHREPGAGGAAGDPAHRQALFLGLGRADDRGGRGALLSHVLS